MDIINDIKKINICERCLIENTKNLKYELSQEREQRSSAAIRIALINLKVIQSELKKTLDAITEYDFVNDFSK